MKIYKLDIDVTKPINQMVAMQQNTTGMLVVTVTKDGGYIRNATCSVYDGENEITPYHIEDNHFWFKVDVGIQRKNLTVKFNATPITSTLETVTKIGIGSGLRNQALHSVEFPAGTYNQDEFLPLAKKFGNVDLYPSAGTLSNVNFKYITIRSEKVWFFDSNNEYIPTDVPIVATGDVEVWRNVQVKRNGAEYGEEDYPSVGYYADCAVDVVVRPSENAAVDGEIEVQDPDIVVDSVTIDGETYPVEWKVITIDGEPVVVLAAKVETPESSDSELDSNDSELIGD